MTRPDRSGLISILILILAPLLFYSAMVIQGWEPRSADTQSVRPFGAWGTELETKLGEIPSWYPYVMSGMPSYGSFIYTPRSPLNPLTALTAPFAQNRGARYLIFFALAGIGGGLFLRRLGASWVAATAGGLFYSMTPYLPGVVDAGHATKLEALAMIPLFFLGIELLIERPNALRSAFLALVGAMLAWAHHPQIAFYGAFLGALYALGRLLLERRTELTGAAWLRLAAFTSLAVVVAGLLVTEPYLGVREYASHSIRGGTSEASGGGAGVGWDYATNWSFHPLEMVSFLFPGWFGMAGQTYWGLMPFTQSTHYFGLVGLALALIGWAAAPRSRRLIFGALFLIVLLIGFGRHLPILFGPMYAAVPLFNKFRVPSMIYSMLPLCLAPLVALGIDSAVRGLGATETRKGGRSTSGSAAAWLPRVTVGLAALSLLWLGIAAGLSGSLTQGNTMIRAEEADRYPAAVLGELRSERFGILRTSVFSGLLLLTLLAGALELGRRRVLSGARLGLVLALLCTADLLWAGRNFYHPEPKTPATQSFPAQGAADYLSSKPGPFRVLPLGSLFGSNGFGMYGVESIGGYQPAKLRIYQDLIESNLLNQPPVLRMLGVRYAVSPQQLRQAIPAEYSGDGFVYDIGEPLPWVWSVDRIERVTGGWQTMSRRFLEPGFEPEVVALLYADGPAPSATSFAAARISGLTRGPEELAFHVESEGTAFVVMSEIFYAPGWRAVVDERPSPIYRVNHVLRGIEVPAGTHRVVLHSVSRGRALGETLSRIGGGILLVLLGIGVVPIFRRSRDRN
ncbi:MAG: hypothetical protein IT349_13235 [Candidatus Eisenbacteria bacterium]|nr:hypothetical protein [Candidatus Eisenbacteria bacterium]